MIAAKLEAGLSAQRIYQDLVEQNDFKGSYQSVQRFVRKLKRLEPQRIWRMEARPGEEVQVDFGLRAPICEEPGRPRKSWVFRMVLSYSRKSLQRSGCSSGYRNIPALFGKRPASLRRGATAAESGQLKSGGSQGRLV